MKKLFRVDKNNPFNGLHQNQYLYRTGAEPQEAKAVMIMIHGRGSNAKGITAIMHEIHKKNKIMVIAPQAMANTWYPHSFLMPREQNQPHLNSGIQAIADAIQKAKMHGFTNENIFMLGFSQGACLASEFVARHPNKYGGIFILSGGLIGDMIYPELYKGDLKQTPIFIGCSDTDLHIPVERIHETSTVLNTLNGRVIKRIYPNMGHTINHEELSNINAIINDNINLMPYLSKRQ